MGNKAEIIELAKRWEVNRNAMDWTHFPWLNSLYNPNARVRLVLSTLGIATALISLIIALP